MFASQLSNQQRVKIFHEALKDLSNGELLKFEQYDTPEGYLDITREDEGNTALSITIFNVPGMRHEVYIYDKEGREISASATRSNQCRIAGIIFAEDVPDYPPRPGSGDRLLGYLTPTNRRPIE